MSIKTILFVDDDRQIRELFRDVLKAAGYRVSCATSAKGGIKLFKTGNYDLVISDIIMENDTGKDMLEYVKTHSPECPVLMITAYTGGMAQELKSMGAFKILYKPFTLKTLLNTINEIEKSKLARVS